MLSSDKPLLDPKEDRLGYAPFAETLAQGIFKRPPSEGLVVAVYGPWGSGKSTVANFVLAYLKDGIDKGEILHVPFNPWWFSGKEDLTRSFFNQLISALSKSKSFDIVRDRIGDFADAISEIPLPYLSSGKILSRLVKPKVKDVVALKRNIDDLLRKNGIRVLITIDDIDRLTSDETRQVFQLVKAVADFPNVIYLLTLDKEVAIKALEGTQGMPGEEYLEKIVQVPFELPMPDKTALRGLFFERLNEVIDNTVPGGFDQTYWTNVYYEGIDAFIRTPRDIVRLSNTLSVTYPAIKWEVNLVDFVAVETLRVFVPKVYDTIRSSPEYFAGYIDSYHFPQRPEIEAILKAIFQEMEDKRIEKSVDSLLKRLFPKLESNYGSDWASEWRRKLRVCSPEIFPVYFRLALSSGVISNSEMNVILSTTSNASRFEQELIRLTKEKRLDGTSKLREFLERLQDYTAEEIPEANIPPIVDALFNVGDLLLLPEDEPNSMFSFGNDVNIGRVIYQLLKRFDEDKRFQTIKTALTNGAALSVADNEITVYGQQYGKWTSDGRASPGEERLLSREHLEELEIIYLEKIRVASRTSKFIKTPKLSGILYRWKEMSQDNEVVNWASEAVASEEGLAQFLEAFLQRLKSQSTGDIGVRISYRLDPNWIEPFVEPSTLIDRARKLLTSTDFTDNQRIALEQFVKEFDMRSQGKDPGAEFRRRHI